MKYQINQQFVNKLVALTQKILIDQASLMQGEIATSHSRLIFSDEDLNEQNNQNALRSKYFPVERQGIVPFAGNGEEEQLDRMFYMTQLRTEIKELTDNYQNFGLILPSSTVVSTSTQGQQNKMYTFRGDQLLSIYKIVFKLCHGFEQRKINQLEKKQGVEVALYESSPINASKKADNPLPDLGEKILVKGPSGNFDLILTKLEVEDMLQSAQRAQELAKLKGITLDHYGRPLLTLFMPNDQMNNALFAEIKKRSLLTKYAAITMPEAKVAEGHEIVVAVKESLHILQTRAALKAQFDLVRTSEGKIKIVQDVQLDANGNAFFIAKDQHGDEFRVEVDLKIPSGEEKKYKFIVSAPNESGISTDFILILNQKELPKLKNDSISDLFEKNDQRVIQGQPSQENSPKNPKIVKFRPKAKKLQDGLDKLQQEEVRGFTLHLPALEKSSVPEALPLEFEEKERLPKILPLPLPIAQPKKRNLSRKSNATRIIVGKKVIKKKLIPEKKEPYQFKTSEKNSVQPSKNSPFSSVNQPQLSPFSASAQSTQLPGQNKNGQSAQLISRTPQKNPLQNPALVAAAAAGGGLLAGSTLITSISVFLGT